MYVKKIFAALILLSASTFSFAQDKKQTEGASKTVTLVLLRHGQSVGNVEKRFTGWSDVSLTETGIKGAQDAGAALKNANIDFDVVHVSMLSRAIKTAWLSMESMNTMWLPVEKHWRLNERCYGDLEGKTRDEVVAVVGKDQVDIWRRSYDVPPPPLSFDDPRSPIRDARYANIDKKLIPQAESLKDTIARVTPYWKKTLIPALKSGKNVLVVGHSTCLRALSSCIDPALTSDELQKLEIPNTTPVVYELEMKGNKLRIVSRNVIK